MTLARLAVVLGLVVTPLACLSERPSPVARRPEATTAPAPRAAAAPTPPPEGQSPITLRFVIRVTGGAQANDRLPLIVALHGLGDSPENFISLYTEMGLRARIAAAAGLDPMGDGYSWFPSRAGTPHAVWVAGIRRAADAIVPEIRRVARENPTCGLPIVTGFSQGAMLSYAVVARPDGGVFAALPLGGLLPRELWPEARDIGGLLPAVYALHGTADDRVPFASDREANEAFRAVGYPAELRAYAGIGHNIPPGMQSDLQARLRTVLASIGCAP